jgi:hypothetical protein
MRTNIFANEFKNMVKRPVEMVAKYFGRLISLMLSLSWTIKNSYAGVSLAKI